MSMSMTILLSVVLVIPGMVASAVDENLQTCFQKDSATGSTQGDCQAVSLLQTGHQHSNGKTVDGVDGSVLVSDGLDGEDAPNVPGGVNVDHGNHGSPFGCNEKLYSWFNETFKNSSASMLTVLDVGGGTGDKSATLQSMDKRVQAQCIDVVESAACPAFDGQDLSAFGDKSIDFVMFAYVFHHAADQGLPLLAEAKRVAKQAVIILEDLKGDNEALLLEQYQHPGCKLFGGCTFRGEQEWEAIFQFAGLDLLEKFDPGRGCMKPYYMIPRGLYILKP
jgi:hypothetical protein